MVLVVGSEVKEGRHLPSIRLSWMGQVPSVLMVTRNTILVATCPFGVHMTRPTRGAGELGSERPRGDIL